MRGREGEMFASIQEFVELAMRTMTNAPALGEVLALQAKLAERGVPGTQGQLGMRMLGGVHQAITETELFPGMPNLMQPLLLQTFARAGITDPDQMNAIREQGMFGRVGNEFLVEALLRNAKQMGLPRFMVARSFGLSQSQFGAFQEAFGGPGAPALRSRLLGVPQDLLERVPPQRVLEVLTAAREGGDVTGKVRAIVERPPTPVERLQAADAQAQQDLMTAFTALTPALVTLKEAAAGAAGGLAWLAKLFGPGGRPGEPVPPVPPNLRPEPAVPSMPNLTPGSTPVPSARHLGRPTRGDRWWEEDRIASLRDMAISQGVPETLVDRLLALESSGGRNVRIGAKGERGPLQMMPATASRVAGYDVDPRYLHSPGGDQLAVRHLASLWRRYKDPELVAAAWNAGEPAVDRARKDADRTGRSWMEFLPPSTRQSYLPAFRSGAASTPEGMVPYSTRATPRPMDDRTFQQALQSSVHVTFDPVAVVIRSEPTGEVVGVAQATPRVNRAEMAGATTSPSAP
jgi:hypothetical protein